MLPCEMLPCEMLPSGMLLGILLCIKSFSTMDKHTANAVYLKVVGKMPWMQEATDAPNNLAAFFAESIMLRK